MVTIHLLDSSEEPMNVTLIIDESTIIMKIKGQEDKITKHPNIPGRLESLVEWVQVFGTTYPIPLQIASNIISKLKG
jgi:hypothetical protein